MTLQADQVSDQNQDASGVEVSKDQEVSQSVDDAQETVSYQQHKRLLAQRKADQLKAKEMAEKLAEYERRDAERQESLLKEQQKYKELAELKEQKLKEYEAREHEREKALMDGAKLNAFKELLPGQVTNKSYYAFVNLDAIEIDPETGVVDQDSVEKQVNEFVTHHRGLFTPNTGARLPHEAPERNEPTSYIDELRKCRTQKELDACKKKWGRD
jgi:hypothetical protein